MSWNPFAKRTEITRISELNQEISKQSMLGNNLNWHRVRAMCNSDSEADEICAKACQNLGLPIVYRGDVYQNWNS